MTILGDDDWGSDDWRLTPWPEAVNSASSHKNAQKAQKEPPPQPPRFSSAFTRQLQRASASGLRGAMTLGPWLRLSSSNPAFFGQDIESQLNLARRELLLAVIPLMNLGDQLFFRFRIFFCDYPMYCRQ